MANYRFFADLGDRTVMAKAAQYDQGERKMPKIWDADLGVWVRATRVVIRKASPSMHECDSRCMNATGRTMQCECACGGKNHGKGAVQALQCVAA